MAAKLLHSLADDNPDLQKQIGCMTGIFQIFDRHHVLTGKRITHKRLPPGNGRVERQSINGNYHQQTSAEINLNKSASEKQRMSTESSRASFSSACSSSASSVDFEKPGHQDVSSLSYDRMIFPETSSSRDSIMNPTNSRHSLDLRDVVKDSMYRESSSSSSSKGLPSIKTTATNIENRAKHRDSPRPFQVPKNNTEQNTPGDLRESLRALAKLRDAPWYYNNNDFRENPRPSSSSSSQHENAPQRFSLDGRENGRMSFESRDYSMMRSTVKLKELPRLSLDGRESSNRLSNFNSKPRGSKSSYEKEEARDQKRSTSVVAKLMGLESLPDSTRATESEPPLLASKPPAMKMKMNNVDHRLNRTPVSPRNPDFVMKPISSSRRPIEPAPWKTHEGNRGSLKTSSKVSPRNTLNSFPSVYSEIEKRLKDLEFKQSGKDLRALKQILEAMQAKGLLENSSEQQQAQAPNNNQQNRQSNLASQGTFESPIVIMKPANKFVEKSGISSKGQNNNNNNNNQSPKFNRKDSSSSSSIRGSSKNARPSHSSSNTAMTSSSSAAKSSSGSLSPRLHQKKVEIEKRSRPPTSPSSSNKPPRRQTNNNNNKHTIESGSPGGRSRPKYPNNSSSQICDDQSSEISNDSKSLSCHDDDASLENEVELLNKSIPRLDEGVPFAELATLPPEHPSPVSVLDNSAYKDDETSPVKQITTPLKGVAARNLNENPATVEDDWKPEMMNRKKLENIENLVQKLRRLNSTHDEARTDYIASLCESSSGPDQRYVSEILLASGLLLRDFGPAGLASVPLHRPSGHPINPELFFVLEQTKSGPKSDSKKPERLHRKLVFDAVNEVLAKKLALLGEEPFSRNNKLARKSLNAQKLLRELCLEIEQFQTVNGSSKEEEEEEEEDDVKAILSDDVAVRSSESWTDFSGQVSVVVLDLERLIFKDLVDEVVRGEAVNLRAKPGGRRRQLFSKK